MSNEAKCSECFGTGQWVRVMPVRFGQPLPPFRPCQYCEGTGKRKPKEEQLGSRSEWHESCRYINAGIAGPRLKQGAAGTMYFEPGGVSF